MATGLNFQTQTIINSNLDPDSSKVNDNNKDNTYLFKAFRTDDTDNLVTEDGVTKKRYKVNTLRIKRDFVFEKNCVKAIRKKPGYEATLCKATINFADTTLLAALLPAEKENKKYCRLDIYLGVEGAEPYIYSTPWVQKGMPFWVEFTVNKNDISDDKVASGKIIAENVAKLIKKNHVFLCDKDLITVTTDGAKLVLEGATEFQRFRNIEISTFADTADYAEQVAKLDTSKEDPEDTITDFDIKLNKRGKNAFGTYSQIVKDLRLPTAANYQWSHIRQVETPIVGAIYDQYIIEYCAPSTNDGMQAVGQRLESHTTHVFWVKHEESLSEDKPGLTKEWEDALKVIDPNGGTLDEENLAPELAR